jgi:ornithine carbamoyltransferase
MSRSSAIPRKAVEGADLVVTDTWVSMHDPESAKERRHNQLRPYQVNEALMARPSPTRCSCIACPRIAMTRRPAR